MEQAMEYWSFTSILAIQEDVEPYIEMDYPMTLLHIVNDDIIYSFEAIIYGNIPQLINTAIHELNDHVDQKNWKLVSREEVHKGQKGISSI